MVRLIPPPSRTTARRVDAPARHTPAPGRRGATLYLAPGPGTPARHRAPPPRTMFQGGRAAHAPLNRYDRLLFWIAGALMRLRTAVVGERVIAES